MQLWTLRQLPDSVGGAQLPDSVGGAQLFDDVAAFRNRFFCLSFIARVGTVRSRPIQAESGREPCRKADSEGVVRLARRCAP